MSRTRRIDVPTVLLGTVVSVAGLVWVHPVLSLPTYRASIGLLCAAYLVVWILLSIALSGRISIVYAIGLLIGCAFTGLIAFPQFPLILEVLMPALVGRLALIWLLGVGAIVALTWLARRITRMLRPARFGRIASSRRARGLAVALKLVLIAIVVGVLGLRLARSGASEGDPISTSSGAGFRVVLFGIDGADWRIIEELGAEGKLPNLARVRSEGATGSLATIFGPSPLLWTSIATGRRPEHHGITDLFEFYEPRSGIRMPNMLLNPFALLQDWTMIRRRIPYTEWQAKPLWSVHSEAGGENLVFNWWFTLPALPVRGILVSDPMLDYSYLDCAEKVTTERIPHAYFPADLRLSSLDRACAMLHRATARQNELDALQALNTHRTDIPRVRSLIGQGDIVDSLQTTQRIGFEVFDSLLASDEFEFAAFVDTSVDMASHHFSLRVFSRGKENGAHTQIVSSTDRAKYFLPVTNAYQEVDAALGRMLSGADERTVVLVVSDHGWNYDGTEHTAGDPGIVALWGAPVEKGLRLEGRSIFDVAPTVLRLLGLPLSAELAGTPIEEALRAESLADLGASLVVNSYGAPESSGPLELSPAENEDYMERLRSLGYLK